MRDRRAEAAHVEPEDEGVETETESEDRTRFTAEGALPPVAEETASAEPTASERAYGAEDPLTSGGQVMEHEEEVDGDAVTEACHRYGIAENDILAVIAQESRGNAHANAGAAQEDHGRHAASGLMQVTEATWKATQEKHHELVNYSYEAHRYDRRVNILVGTAALADKRDALTRLGIPASSVTVALETMAFNAGEGIVADAYERAVHAGEVEPGNECLREEYLKPAIAKYPSVYAYYLTGAGKKANPERSVERAIELKFREISKYPGAVEELVAEADAHEITDDELDMPRMPEESETEIA
jgi:hypothetical protein